MLFNSLLIELQINFSSMVLLPSLPFLVCNQLSKPSWSHLFCLFRYYIGFQDCSRENTGFNGSTFAK